MSTLRHAGDELDLSPEQFDHIRAILSDRAGITLTDNAEKLVVSRLSKHLRRLNLRGFAPYLRLVASHAGGDELNRMVEALTTNTTRFFREAEHFGLMETRAMPRLIRKARAGGRVRLWSAACSSGEEPYSIAATVLKIFPDAGQYDVKILATDINSQVVARGEAGLYDGQSIRDVPADLHRLMFEPDPVDDRARIRASLRDLVTFRRLNLVEPWPFSGPFDVIFCRNVVIYMDPPTQHRVWEGLESVLDPDGFLFIGHSERIGPALSDRLELFATTSFRRPPSRRGASIPPEEQQNVPS